MTVIDKINCINDVIKELFEFVQTDEKIKADFDEYLTTLNARNVGASQMEKLFIPYVFERYPFDNSTSVVELFCKSNKPKNSKPANSLLSAQYSIFKVNRVLKNGFSLFNLTNEKDYTVLSLTKMTNFRGISIGEYIVARIFKYEDEYYLVGIDNVLSPDKTKDAIRYAILKIIQTPWLVYNDNPQKEQEIKTDISKMSHRFKELFKTDEIVTTNRFADTIIEVLNEEDDFEKLDMAEVTKPLNEYKYFTVDELNNNYDNFLEKSLGGFSSHLQLYDVGIVMDDELGLFSIPFYKTFCTIFENKDKVNDPKGCINYFLSNDSISDKIIKRIAEKYSNFMEVVNDVLGSDYTLESLIQTFKPEYLKRKIYSSTTVLYHSTVFSTSIEQISTSLNSEQEKKEQQTVSVTKGKIGRNDPCPCGSGKKYKNCCLNKNS